MLRTGAADLGRPAGEHRRPLGGIYLVHISAEVACFQGVVWLSSGVVRVVRELLGSSWVLSVSKVLLCCLLYVARFIVGSLGINLVLASRVSDPQ